MEKVYQCPYGQNSSMELETTMCQCDNEPTSK